MNINSINPIINETQKAISNDGKLDRNELKNLKQIIYSSNLDQGTKDSAVKFLEETKSQSLCGISNSDLSELKSLANSLPNNTLAKKLDENIESTLISQKSSDKNNVKNRNSSSSSPNNVSFPERVSPKGGMICTNESKDVKKWHTPQFAEYEKQYGDFFANKDEMREKTGGDSPKAGLKGQEAEWRKAYSSCGPTCVDMVLKAKGFGDKNIEELRSLMEENKYGATDSDNLVRGIEKASDGKLDAKEMDITTNAEDFVSKLRNEIGKGNMPIMLSAFISPTNSPSGGHYVVINGVKDDGSLIVANPYSRNPTEEISFTKLKEAFDYRAKNHKGDEDNVIISVSNRIN